MNSLLKSWMSVVLVGVLLLLPACSSDRGAKNNAELNEASSSQQVITHKSGAKKKKKNRENKKRTQSTPKAVIKGVGSVGLGLVGLAGIAYCALGLIVAPSVLLIPPVVITAGYCVGSYKLGKSGYEDYVAKDETEQAKTEVAASASEK